MANISIRGFGRYHTDGVRVFEGSRIIPAQISGDYMLVPDGEQVATKKVEAKDALTGNPPKKAKKPRGEHK